MKKVINILDFVFISLLCALPECTAHIIPYPFSVVVCAGWLAVTVAYIVFCFKKKLGVATYGHLGQILIIAPFVIVPISCAIFLVVCNLKGINTLYY